MKKYVFTYGLIAGICVASFMAFSIAYCYSKNSFDGSMLLGYAVMLLSFSAIFVGVKNYRDNDQNGFISFGSALLMSLYMTILASTIYVAGWMFAYYNFFPDFMERLAAYQLSPAKISKMSASEVADLRQGMEAFKNWYSTPLGVAGATYLEILPVGMIVSLVSALILKRSSRRI